MVRAPKGSGPGLTLAFVLGVVGVVASVVGYAVLQAAYRDGARPKQTVEVVVALVDVPAGTPLEADAVAVRSVEATEAALAGASTTDEVIGHVAVVAIPAGRPVRRDLIRAPAPSDSGPRLSELIPTGHRALSVTFTLAEGEPPVQAGDTVDVVALFAKGTDGLAEDERALVASGVVVLDVSRGSEEPERAVTAPKSGGATGRAVLVVTPEQAQLLTFSQEKGQLILVRRKGR